MEENQLPCLKYVTISPEFQFLSGPTKTLVFRALPTWCTRDRFTIHYFQHSSNSLYVSIFYYSHSCLLSFYILFVLVLWCSLTSRLLIVTKVWKELMYFLCRKRRFEPHHNNEVFCQNLLRRFYWSLWRKLFLII